jgi:hypothetical protein
MFSSLSYQVLWEIMKCTKFLGKLKYLFLCYSKGNNSDMVETRIFFSIEWYNFQVEIRMCIISYIYKFIISHFFLYLNKDINTKYIFFK